MIQNVFCSEKCAIHINLKGKLHYEINSIVFQEFHNFGCDFGEWIIFLYHKKSSAIQLVMVSVMMKRIILNATSMVETVACQIRIQITVRTVYASAKVLSYPLDFLNITVETCAWHGLFNFSLDNILRWISSPLI